MTTSEVAHKLVALCREGKYLEAVETLYDPDIVSVEAKEFAGMPRELRGKEAVRGKNQWWFEANEVHSSSVAGPYLTPERFAAVHTFDSTIKATGVRRAFTEVAVYTVENGRITREEFFYDN